MSAIQRKSKKEQTETVVPVQESIEIPLPQPKKKEKSSSKQEPVPVVVDDDSTQSAAVAVAIEEKPKSSKKEKSSSKQKETEKVVVDDSIQEAPVAEPVPSKKGKGKQPAPQIETSGDESNVEVVEKSKKQPPKPLGEQMTDSIETLNQNVEKSKILIELKDTLQKQISPLISSRKKELKKLKVDEESEDSILQFLEKQKECLKNEILELKSSIRDLTSVSKVIEKGSKQVESGKKKSVDPSKPKKERSKIFVPVSTDVMNKFIEKYHTLKTNDGNNIFEQKPEKNSDGRFLVERTQLMQLIHAYIREKSLRNTYPEDNGRILLNDELKPLFSSYLEGDFDKRVDSKSILSVLSHHLEKKA